MNQRKIIYLIISASILVNLAAAEDLKSNFDLTTKTVFQGENTGAYLSISNEGIDTINDIKITMFDPTLGISNTITVPKLAAGSLYSKTFDIQTLKSTPDRKYNVTVTIEYGSKVLTLRDTLEVQPFPVETVLSIKNNEMSPGEMNTLTVSVANMGNADIKNLFIGVKAPSNFRLNSTANLTLPDLSVGSSITKKFDFKAISTSAGDYHLIVDVSFIDSKGETHSDEAFMKVTVSSGLSFAETLAIVIILVLMVAFFIRKIV